MSMRGACALGLGLVLAGCVEDEAGDDLEEVDVSEHEIETKQVVDTFSRGANRGGWVIGGSGGDVIETSGGNPGAYLHDANQDAPAPSVHTTGSSVFTGDYTAAGVTELSVSLIVEAWGLPPPASTHVHLVLTNDRGTPSALDDAAVWVDSGGVIPPTGGGWRNYVVSVPSDSTSLPAGWTAYDSGFIVTGAAANDVWNEVVGSVTRVGWSHGAPLSPNLFSFIDSGLDNAAIRRSLAAAE
jgi:hypothetical protein